MTKSALWYLKKNLKQNNIKPNLRCCSPRRPQISVSGDHLRLVHIEIKNLWIFQILLGAANGVVKLGRVGGVIARRALRGRPPREYQNMLNLSGRIIFAKKSDNNGKTNFQTSKCLSQTKAGAGIFLWQKNTLHQLKLILLNQKETATWIPRYLIIWGWTFLFPSRAENFCSRKFMFLFRAAAKTTHTSYLSFLVHHRIF